MLVSEVLKKAGVKSQLPIKEQNFKTMCPACGESFHLRKCRVADEGDETIYRCGDCDELLIIVSRSIDIPRKGYGYRLGDYVIRNVTDITFGRLLIDASPDALAGRRK